MCITYLVYRLFGNKNKQGAGQGGQQALAFAFAAHLLMGSAAAAASASPDKGLVLSTDSFASQHNSLFSGMQEKATVENAHEHVDQILGGHEVAAVPYVQMGWEMQAMC